MIYRYTLLTDLRLSNENLGLLILTSLPDVERIELILSPAFAVRNDHEREK